MYKEIFPFGLDILSYFGSLILSIYALDNRYFLNWGVNHITRTFNDNVTLLRSIFTFTTIYGRDIVSRFSVDKLFL